MATQKPSFVIIGAGAIGSFYGVLLHKAGFPVKFLVRDSERSRKSRAVMAQTGLELRFATESSFLADIPASAVPDVFTTDASCLNTCSYVLVATKRTENKTVSAQLVGHGVKCPVVFLQNGLRTTEGLETAGYQAVESVVTFNVTHNVEEGKLLLPQAVADAELVIDGSKECAQDLSRHVNAAWTACGVAGSHAKAEVDFFAVQCGKLLLNLTNAVNALCGEAIEPMLLQANYRLVLAASLDEARAVYAAMGVTPKASHPRDRVLIKWFTFLLRSPQPVFVATVGRKLKGRGAGRTSMAQDLIARRVPTEIDFLNGEIVRLAKQHGVATPVNERIIALVKEAETKNVGSPNISGEALLQAVGLEPRGCFLLRMSRART